MQGKLKQTKVYYTLLYFVWKKTTHESKEVAAAKPIFSSVCCWCNLLRWNVFILCHNWKTLLLIIVYRYSEVVLNAVLLLYLNSVLIALHNNSTMLIPKFQSKADYAFQISGYASSKLLILRQLQVFLSKWTEYNFSL